MRPAGNTTAISLPRTSIAQSSVMSASFSSTVIFEEISVYNYEQIENTNNEEMYLEYSIEYATSIDSVKIYFDSKLQKMTSETNEASNNVIYIPKTAKNIRIEVNEQDKDKLKLKLYRFSIENFQKIYEVISQEQLKVEEKKSYHIRGTVDTKQGGLLLTSIINDKGWTVKVDGKKVEKQSVAENLLAIDLRQGEHIIEFSYKPTGFNIGLVLSFIGIILLIFNKIKEKLIY